MQVRRTYIFIAISSIALFIVLMIQVNWIFQTAKIKEELFNEKANMVLAKTTDALYADKKTYRQMEICVGKNEIHKIDSLFKYYMDFYDFHIDYTFEVIQPKSFLVNNPGTFASVYPTATVPYPPTEPGCSKKKLEEVANKNGLELKLAFPGKRQFIMAEMGTPFVSSVILILVVLVLFWHTISSLLKEKRISEHTNDFLNNMTHEFKTPLTNIALASKMITRDATIGQEDKVKYYSGIIREENEKLQVQVEQVLSMTAFERGEIPLYKTALDIHELIRDVVKCMNLQIENKKGSLKLDLNADKSMVMADRTHLTNALCNLIDNAIKYAMEEPVLWIRTSHTGSHIIMIIQDQGIGIDKAYQKKVFDKFFRVPTGDVHDVKGFGLGLAYTKKIIELHQGSIELQSEKGKGATFTITLPDA
jgi:two-component system phosphate regulon sensor histidine kinase PhoR